MPKVIRNNLRQGNQWAYLTEMSIHSDPIAIHSLGGDFIQEGMPEIEFTGIAPATPEIISAIRKWMYHDQPAFPFYAEEWMCLYCGSPNPLPETHCKKCGAPRNWLIG